MVSLSPTGLLRAAGIGTLGLIGFVALFGTLPGFTVAALLVVGAPGALVAVVSKKPMLQVAGLAVASTAIFAVAVSGTAFLIFGIIAVLAAVFGGK